MLHRRTTLVALFAFGLLGACASTTSPKNDLGTGGGICPSNPQQCEGKCCGDKCTLIQVDRNNCGDCLVQCPAGELCAGGTCGCPVSVTSGNVVKCPMGQSCCGVSGCKNLQTDINNCGQCGTKCAAGATCAGGQCICGGRACGVGEVCCNGTCSSTCAVDMATPARDMGGGGGNCVCASGCPLSMLCVGPNCCYEDILLGGTCTPDPACLGI